MNKRGQRIVSRPPGQRPSNGACLRTLRDGYWDRTDLWRLPDDSLRVRKSSRGAADAGPWGVNTLRREIAYLQALDGPAAACFPEFLAGWDDGDEVGYEIAFVQDAVTVSDLAQSAQLSQDQVDRFQKRLAEMVFHTLHSPAHPEGPPLSEHLTAAIETVLTNLTAEPPLARLIDAPTVTINNHEMLGPRAAFTRITDDRSVLARLNQPPQVRLHGDCFLENIMAPPPASDASWPQRIILLDPVSVAGVAWGHPLFDLVKYDSYASGELPALRAEKITADGFDAPTSSYTYQIHQDDPAIRPFYQIDWLSRWRQGYTRRHGPIDQPVYHLLEGYFALVMALCTQNRQRRGRLLTGTIALNAALMTQ